MWAIVFILANAIWNKVDARYINKLDKGHPSSDEDKEFEKLEKRQKITGELEVNGQRFESLGCWRDAWARGLPSIEGEHYLLMDPNYKGRNHGLFKCARAAADKGRKVFGIENGGQCFASDIGEKRYRKYGPSKECKTDGKGGPWSIQVYRFVDHPKAVNGNYSPWSPWTQCSKSCSGGVRRRMRKCSNPPPSNGGRDCRTLGSSVESQDCNVKLCSGKSSVGPTEPRTVRYTTDGGHVRQLAGTDSPLSLHGRGQNIGGNQERHQVDNQFTRQPASHSFNSNSNANNEPAKYISMSRKEVKNFKQVAPFQQSQSKPGQVSEDFKGKEQAKSPAILSKDLPAEGNAFKQTMPFSRKAKGQQEIMSDSSKTVADATSLKNEKGNYPSSAYSPGNHVRPEGSFQMPLAKEHSMNGNSIHGNYEKMGKAIQTEQDKSNKMSAAENEHNSKYITLTGSPLQTMKPGFIKSPRVDNQEQRFSQQHSDGEDTKQNGFNSYPEMKKRPEDFAKGQQLPVQFKENAFTNSNHMPSAGVESSSRNKQTTGASPKAGYSMEQGIKQPSVTGLQGNPMAATSDTQAAKQGSGFAQEKLSDKGSQQPDQTPAGASPMSNKLQGPISQHMGHGDNVPITGGGFSNPKEKPAVGMSPQQVQSNLLKEQDSGAKVQQSYPQQGHGHMPNNPAPLTEGNKLHQTTESNGNSKSDQGQTSDEGEPVPMVDLSNGGTDFGPTNGQELQGPVDDTGMQSQPGEDYAPGGFPSPGEDTTGQQSGPEYDNEAIQGISDLSRKEDQTILQQVNSEGQTGSDQNVMVGYNDGSMSQAYTGESSRGEGQYNIQRTQDDMQQESNSSGARPGTDYYNTEPADDCPCPKKECSAKADVAFLVDGSANIPQPYYARVLEFIKIFSRGFDKSNTHVGLMAYGDNVKTALDLKGLNDFRQFDDAVNIAPYVGGKAYTGNALLQMKGSLFAVSGRQDAPRALILLSSGASADDVVGPAEEVRDSGVKVTAIGLGKQANVRELINVASEPKSDHVFTAFLDTLPNAMDEIIQGVCRDVMGIVRDRQVPCTCETNNGQIGPSSDYSKEYSEKLSEKAAGQDPQQKQDSYSQNNDQSDVPNSQGEQLRPNVKAQDSYQHSNGSQGSQPADISGTSDDGRLVYTQQNEQTNGASEKPEGQVSSEHQLSVTYSPNGQHNQNNDASAVGSSHDQKLLNTQRQQSNVSEERQKAVQDDKIREDEENSIGSEDYPADSVESRKNDNGGHEERLKDGRTQEQEPEAHHFAAGHPEHYQPHVSIYVDETSGEKPLTQGDSKGNANQQSAQGDDTSQGASGTQGDLFQSATYNHERVQGSGSQAQPSFVPLERENNNGRQENKGELSSDYKGSSKVVAAGHAAENLNTGAQEEDRHECGGKVHLGVVLDSSETSQNSGKDQVSKMMDLAKQVSHLFPVSPEGNSVGMVVYGGSPQPSVVHFDKFLDQQSMDQAIDKAGNPSFEIKIGKALSLAQDHLFSPLSTSKHNVLLLVTDGFSTDDVDRPAIELKRRGIEVFCLGVGPDVNKTQLDFIASEPKNEHVFLAPFNDANALIQKIQKGICQSAKRSVAARLQTQRKCPSDLGFVIDGARTIEVLGKGNFKKMLDFVKNVSLGFHISPEETRVGAITYGTEPMLSIPFNKYNSAKDLALAIENIIYSGTITMTGKALALAHEKLFDKGSRINVPKVLVVLTEGTSRDDVQHSAQALHRDGVTVISVGLGPVYNTSQLDNVASMPTANHVIKTKFNELQSKVNELQDKICQAKIKQYEQI